MLPWQKNPHTYNPKAEIVGQRDGEWTMGWPCTRCGEVYVPSDVFSIYLPPPRRFGCTALPVPASPPAPPVGELPVPTKEPEE